LICDKNCRKPLLNGAFIEKLIHHFYTLLLADPERDALRSTRARVEFADADQ
jgi:hypothetical protein